MATTDIYIVAEDRLKTPKHSRYGVESRGWYPMFPQTFTLPRNYDLFKMMGMGGDKNAPYPLRGLPEDVSPVTRELITSGCASYLSIVEMSVVVVSAGQYGCSLAVDSLYHLIGYRETLSWPEFYDVRFVYNFR